MGWNGNLEKGKSHTMYHIHHHTYCTLLHTRIVIVKVCSFCNLLVDFIVTVSRIDWHSPATFPLYAEVVLNSEI